MRILSIFWLVMALFLFITARQNMTPEYGLELSGIGLILISLWFKT